MNHKIEEDSLFKCCQQAVDMTINQGTICTGFSIAKCFKNLLELTSPNEWARDFLFERVAKTYFAIYANQIGKRAGIKGKGVYYDEDSMHKAISEGLAMNEKDLAESYISKSNDLDKKIVANATDGQIAIDGNNQEINLFEEVSLEKLTEIILAKDGV